MPLHNALKKFVENGSATVRIVVLALGFLLLLSQINGRGYINEILLSQTHGIIPNLGFFGNATYYLVFGLSAVILSGFTKSLGPVKAMVLGGTLTLVWEISFFVTTNWTFIFFNAVAGVGAALSWPAMGNFIARTTNDEEVMRHNALCWGISQLSQIVSPLILLAVFHNKGEIDDGQFTPGAATAVHWCFIVILIGAIYVFCQLPNPDHKAHEPLSPVQTWKAFFRLLFTKKMFWMILPYFHAGFSQALWMSIFPSMVSNYKRLPGDGLQNMALSALFVGLGEMAVCPVAFFLVRSFISKTTFARYCGSFLQVLIAILIFFAMPHDANYHATDDAAVWPPSKTVILAIAFLIGFSDGTWNICVYEATEEYFPGQSLLAFVVFNLVQSWSTTLAFATISHISLWMGTFAFGITTTVALYGYQKLLKYGTSL